MKALDCISVENMRESDRMTIEKYVSGRTLMYRAAMGVFRVANWHGEIAIAVGGGNNGGDGYALACILKRNDYTCRIVKLSVDINSGMNGDTGEAETAVHSDITVTIGYVKRGLVSPNAARYMKRLVVADIGIVLAKEEEKLVSADADIQPNDGCIIAPDYLVMEPINVSHEELPN